MTEKEILDRINNGEKLEIEIKEIVPTPTNENSELRIRKLTPKECIKLMGFETQDYEKLKKCGLSDSAIYHIAGDSIITTCIVALFSEMCNVDQTEIIETYTKGLIEK